jgi:agmatine/peptidylarginine deiminase
LTHRGVLIVVALLGISGAELVPERGRTRAEPTFTRGLVLPGEFEPVELVLMTWDDGLADFYAEILLAIEDEADAVFAVEADEIESIREGLILRGSDLSRVRFTLADADTVWMRDYGPLAVRGRDGTRATVHFDYPSRPLDDELSAVVTPQLWPGRPLVRAPLSVEGGNLLSDGSGRCLTTTLTLQAEQGTRTPSGVARLLERYLGCRSLIVLPRLAGEPTGHVDMYATITGPGEVIVGRYDPLADPDNAALLEEVTATLQRAGFVVRRVPMPSNDDGKFRSYTNALAVNGVVMVPTYDDDAEVEHHALSVFRAAYPGRRVVAIDARAIIELDGAVHCAAMTIAR